MPKGNYPNREAIPDTDEWDAGDWDEEVPASQSTPNPVEVPAKTGIRAWFKTHPAVLGFLLFIFIVGGTASFQAFAQDSERLGGNALNGYEEQGHYYVSGYGAPVQVSKADWEANQLRAILGLIGFVLAFFSIGYVAIRLTAGRLRSAFSLRDDAPVMDDPVLSLLTTNPLMDKIMAVPEDTEPAVPDGDLTGHRLLAETNGRWGKVGKTTIPMGGLSVYAFSDGIVLSAGISGSATIKPAEVSSVTYKKRGAGAGVKIAHRSKEIDSPVFIGGVKEDSAFGQALNKVVGLAKVA
jgi:hypothetical protein